MSRGPDWAPTEAGEPPSLVDAAVHLPDRYVDLGRIGAGGMGQVRRVHDRSLDRVLVMKIMAGDLARQPAARLRFQREARITAGLQHPGIIAVYDQGELADGRPWYTMREVEGPTLATLEGTLWQKVEALERVAQAMAYAHRRGVVHRDLKPSNVMVGAFGEVLVLDWGLARRVEEPTETAEISGASTGTGLTRVGAVMGTPAYMAPEQAAGRWVGPPADVFALGVMLREMMAGGAPTELAELVERATADHPIARFADAAPVAEALRAWLAGSRRLAEARAVLDQAVALRERLTATRAEAARLQAEAAAVLAPLPPHAPVEEKAPGWRLEQAARQKARSVRLMEVEVVQKARAALERAPDLVEAHHLLADLYQQRAQEAEARRDEDAAAEYLALLSTHDRGWHAEWIAGQGRITLHTHPPGVSLTLYRVVEEGERLVPRHPVWSGVAPIVDLTVDPGLYEIHIESPGRPRVVIPLQVERCERWSAGPPGDPHRPIVLPVLGIDEVYVPAGWCIIGGDPKAIDGLPRRRVWIDGFVMHRFAVTRAQYAEFLNDLIDLGQDDLALRCAPQPPASGPGTRLPLERGADGRFTVSTDEANHPMVLVNRAGALAYAAWYGQKRGQRWGLPHELAWEKAARGVDGRTYPWGERFEATWSRTTYSVNGPATVVPVDSYPEDVSCYGVRGLAGNVRDWCGNLLLEGPPDDGAVVLPLAEAPPTAEAFCAVKGGSIFSLPDLVRVAARLGGRADVHFVAVGFRLVRPV